MNRLPSINRWKPYEKWSIIIMIATLILLLVGWQLVDIINRPPAPSPTLITLPIPGDGGTVQKSPDTGGRYNQKDRVTLEARPASGFRFVRWSGDLTGTMNPTVITMDRDKNVNAEFERYP